MLFPSRIFSRRRLVTLAAIIIFFTLRFALAEPPVSRESFFEKAVPQSAVSLRTFAKERLNRAFPEPAASMAAGLLLGAREEIPKSLLEDFRRAGLTHILAVSGYNIVIVIGAMSALFIFLPFRAGHGAVIAGIIFFIALTGASASVVRAGIMGSLGVIARIFSRRAKGMRPLFITAAVMVAIDPHLIRDIGFQLSCAATAGLILLSSPLQEQRILAQLDALEIFGVKEIFASTMAATFATLPIILYHFGSFSFVGIIANVAVLPFIPFLMMGSFLALFFGKIAAAPTWLLFEFVFTVVHFFAGLPWAYVEMD